MTIRPGKSTGVHIRLEDGRSAHHAVPAWAAVGSRPGPRISIIGAPLGYEGAAGAAARRLIGHLRPAELAGSLTIVPVWRPGGHFSRMGRPIRAWRLPGDLAGGPAARSAFTLYSEVVVGASALLVLASPRPGRLALPTARGDLGDARIRRLALGSGMAVAVNASPRPGSILAAAAQAGVPALELRGTGAETDAADEDASLIESSVLRLLGLLGVMGRRPTGDLTPAVDRLVTARAPIGGLLRSHVAPGHPVRRGVPLAEITPVLGARSVLLTAPTTGVVLEAPARVTTRRGAILYVLTASAVRAVSKAALRVRGIRPHTTPAGPREPLGWAETVTLPDLGVRRLKAKIDTGARTSALHVSGLRLLRASGRRGSKSVVEFSIPGRPSSRVRAALQEHVVVRDSSGRSERRPTIETTLRLGKIDRKVRVTLTNRGDMLFPMLIGRTAIAGRFVVDPSRRYLGRGKRSRRDEKN